MSVATMSGPSQLGAICQSVSDQGQKFINYVGNGVIHIGDSVLEKVKHLGDSTFQAAKFVGNSVSSVASNIADIKDDATAHTHLWKALHAGLEAIKSKSAVMHTASRAIALLDAAQFFADIGDLFSGKLAKLKWNDLITRVSFGLSNLGTTVLYANEIASQFGVALLGAKLAGTYTAFACGGATIGFSLGAADGIYRLLTLPETHKVEIATKALLDTVSSLAGAALTAIGLFGLAYSTVAIALLTLAYAGCGILSFCYKNQNKEIFEDFKPPESNKPSFWSSCSLLVNQIEGFEKVTKLLGKLAEGVSNVFVHAVAGDLKHFIEMHEVLNIFKRWKDWTVPDDKGEYFWNKAANSTCKVVSKVFLSLLAVVTVVAFTHKYLLELAFLSSLSIGGISFLMLAAPAVFFGYTFFSAIDNATELKNEGSEKSSYFRTKAVKKIEHWNKMASLANTKAVQEKILHSRDKRAHKLGAQGAAIKALNFKQYTAWNLARLNTRYENACMRCNKFGLGFLSDAPKALGAVFGIASMVAGTTLAAPVVAAQLGVAAATLSLTGAFASLYKYVYDTEYNKPKPLPRVPAAG